MNLIYNYVKKYEPIFFDLVKKGEITSIATYDDVGYKVGDYICIRAYDRGFCSEKLYLEVVYILKKRDNHVELGVQVEHDDCKAIKKVLFRQNGPLAANYVEVC